jgi:hypothetical protein
MIVLGEVQSFYGREYTSLGTTELRVIENRTLAAEKYVNEVLDQMQVL